MNKIKLIFNIFFFIISNIFSSDIFNKNILNHTNRSIFDLIKKFNINPNFAISIIKQNNLLINFLNKNNTKKKIINNKFRSNSLNKNKCEKIEKKIKNSSSNYIVLKSEKQKCFDREGRSYSFDNKNKITVTKKPQQFNIKNIINNEKKKENNSDAEFFLLDLNDINIKKEEAAQTKNYSFYQKIKNIFFKNE